MTDRHSGFLVVLDQNMREDDAEHIRHALQLIKGILKVTPIPADYTNEYAQQARIRTKLAAELHEIASRLAADVTDV